MTQHPTVPHGGIPTDDPALVWTHVLSDGVTGISYWAIAGILVYLVFRANREQAEDAPGLKRLPYPLLFLAFGLFIMACGTVHLFLMWTVWQPVYAQLGVAKAFMAVASVGTAIALPPLVPRVLKLLREARLSEERQKQLEAAHRDLQEAHDRVTEYDELKSQFFQNVSHELRTPLTLILGPIESMLDDELSSDTRHQLDTIQRNARLLRRHVDDLLDVSRLDVGRLEPAFARIDLATLVRTTAAHFDGLARDVGTTFVVETPPELGAEVDSDKVERILLNLLSNAFKFTPAGGRIAVRLTTRTGGPARDDEEAGDRPPGNAVAVLEVRDDGPGVPEPLREAIFERFRQVEGGSGRRFGGTGLGLAIVREFADLHGGSVEVGDAPEGGACFVVEIPLRAPADSEVRAAEPEGTDDGSLAEDRVAELSVMAPATRGETPAEGRAEPDENAAPGHLLVVEDNPEMLRHLARLLGDEYRITTARDGEEALDAFQREAPDLVLTDVMMPGMTGDRLVREIRERSEWATVPIVVLTAKADEELRIRVLQEGAQDFLIKPFSQEELRARIGNLIEAKRSGDVLRRALTSSRTDLGELSRQIVRSRDELSRAVEEARRAHAEAESASRAKTEFLSVMSHELRTPLNAIVGYVDLLLSGAAGTDLAHREVHLRRIQTNSQALTRMIEQILELTRLEDGEGELDVRESDLSEALDELIRKSRGAAEAKGLRFVVRMPERPAPIRTDVDKLRQVIDDLVSNAVKFTSEGTVELHVEMVDGEILARVRDTGPGLATEELERAFEPFWQADPGLTRKEGGSGLGLSIVRRFTRLLGGEVALESEPGAGTTATLRVPADAERGAVNGLV